MINSVKPKLSQLEIESGIRLIPVKPQVRKYLLAMYGDIVPVSGKNAIGQQMLAFDVSLDECLPDDSHQGLVWMKFQFAHRHMSAKYNEHHAAFWAGTWCWSIFSITMLTWVDAQVQAGMEAWASLRDFLEQYDIDEEEYSLESAYRYWLKYRPVRESVARGKKRMSA